MTKMTADVTRAVWVMNGEAGCYAICVGDDITNVFGKMGIQRSFSNLSRAEFQKKHCLGHTIRNDEAINAFIGGSNISVERDAAEYLDVLASFLVKERNSGTEHFVYTDPGEVNRVTRTVQIWKRELASSAGAGTPSSPLSSGYKLAGVYAITRGVLALTIGAGAVPAAAITACGYVAYKGVKYFFDTQTHHYSVKLVDANSNHTVWFELHQNGGEPPPLCMINGRDFISRQVYPVKKLPDHYDPLYCGLTSKSNEEIKTFNKRYLRENKTYNLITNNCMKYAEDLVKFLITQE